MKKSQSPNGFSLVEVMIVVAIIALLAAIAIPNFIKAREDSWRNECRRNLTAIENAKVAACANGTTPTPTFEGEAEVAFLQKVGSRCPAGGIYSVGACGKSPTCSKHSDIPPVGAEPSKNP